MGDTCGQLLQELIAPLLGVTEEVHNVNVEGPAFELLLLDEALEAHLQHLEQALHLTTSEGGNALSNTHNL